MNAIVLLVFAVIPPAEVAVEETVQTIELNHFYDDNGKLRYDQIIFYNKLGEIHDHRVVKNPNQIPQRDWKRGGYQALWYDLGTLRLVRSVAYRETWTQHDPESFQGHPHPYIRERARTLLRGTFRPAPATELEDEECECCQGQ